MEQELKKLDAWVNEGHKTVLAFVTKTWGSAPRQVGSVMIVRGDGVFEGSVSGGCVEGSVIAEASALMESDTPTKSLHFAVSNGDAWSVGLACGGEIEILLVLFDPNSAAWLKTAISTFKNRKHSYLQVAQENGNITLTNKVEKNGSFTVPITPKPRLYIIGAVHIAQHLCVFANESSFDITIIDPREGFTTSRDFKNANIINDWPDDYFNEFSIDQYSGLIALTHDPKLDDPALIPALESDAFYIGALGSTKTNASRMSRLREEGFSEEVLSRIHGPIGINIGSKTPAEIAVSIIAEVIQSYRKMVNADG